MTRERKQQGEYRVCKGEGKGGRAYEGREGTCSV